MKNFDFNEVEDKWKQKLEGFGGYKGVDMDLSRKKFYMLTEFPYPSGSGLHVGHAFSMTGADVYARFQRMKGKNVVFPMGWDAFGLPTENFAIKTGIKPQEATKQNTDKFKLQMESLGFSFDWDREVNTTDPAYYKWTQWIFTKLFEKGLAYKQEMPINWCPSCKIGLANEEVINGKCERCGTGVEKRTQSQWVVKITAYADKLIDGLSQTDFIEKVKASQINWIDRREGAKVRFQLFDSEEQIEVFTSRVDTLAGATFLVVAPEHKLVERVKDRFEVQEYLNRVKNKSELERTDLNKDKTGVFSGLYAINPYTKEQIPVWIADYVLMSYGTGAIMAVPSHDERDGEFAKKFNVKIDWEFKPDLSMIEWVTNNGVGEVAVTYHLRDWIFSRQHYWGEPIPMIYCENDGWVSVSESELPVVLPEVEAYQPTDTGESPLANIKEWVQTVCPKCGGLAKRETDTMPNWAGSDWYFLRYIDPKNNQSLADEEKLKYWLPVDIYVGGDEHNTLHLLYSRFIYQFLWDLGVVPKEYPEPYKKRLSHGIILGPDGNKMSKSKGNVIVPGEMIQKYGADAVRMYMMFMGPFDATMAWNEQALVGVKRFVDRLYRLVAEKVENKALFEQSDKEIKVLINRLVKESGDDLSSFKFNTIVARLMGLLNQLEKNGMVSTDDLKKVVLVMAPMAPFVSEELWEMLGGDFSVHSQNWPKYDETLMVSDLVKLSVQINGKFRGVVELHPEAEESEVMDKIKRESNLSKYLENGQITKTIYIKGKTINLVVG